MSYIQLVNDTIQDKDLDKAKEFTAKFIDRLEFYTNEENMGYIINLILTELKEEENPQPKKKHTLIKKVKSQIDEKPQEKQEKREKQEQSQEQLEPHMLPERPAPTGFSLFAVQNRDIVKAKMPNSRAKDITAELYKMWNELSNEEKSKFNIVNEPKVKIKDAKEQNLFLNITKANKMKVDELRQYIKDNIDFFKEHRGDFSIDSMKKADMLQIVKA